VKLAGTGLPAAILLGLAVRVPFWVEALRTPVDGDTAIVGLMARHLGQGTTFWGQPYGSPLDAWVAAPFVAAMGPTTEAVRLPVFLLGLALIPIAYALGRALHPAAAVPAAVLMACPPPYFVLLSALPPPLYATTLALCGLVLVLGLRLGATRAEDPPPWGRLALLGALAGLALWTHLMSGTAIAAVAVHLLGRFASRRRLLLVALVPLLLASSPWWLRALVDRQATAIVQTAGRDQSMTEHLAAVVPRLHETVAGLLGAHVPMVADSEDYQVQAPALAAFGVVLIYAVMTLLAVRASGGSGGPGLLLAAAVLALVAFPLPIRSAPHNLRFLTPMYLPLLGLVVSVLPTNRPRRGWLVVLGLATLHLAGTSRLLDAWREADRAAPPFSLPDLAPVQKALEAQGVRHAYASYGPAYRLTYESGERIVASQPWNERFRHYPLPFLDEVRFAKDVAWVLTSTVATDLPSPAAFESSLAAIGGRFRRTEAGAAVAYHAFVPPYSASVEPHPDAGPVSDGDPAPARRLDSSAPVDFTLPAPRALAAITLVAPLEGPRLLRSMDVLVSADGVRWEHVAARRRRDERADLRWVNGHPQYVLDHDLIAIPLGGRTVSVVRIVPVASGDEWALAEVLLHPASAPPVVSDWTEWLDPKLGWPERRQALLANPHRDREDWYWRMLVAARHP